MARVTVQRSAAAGTGESLDMTASDRSIDPGSRIIPLLRPDRALASERRGGPTFPGVEEDALPLALARALASSSLWHKFRKAVLVARCGPHPLLGLAGEFDRADDSRIGILHEQLACDLPNLRYIDHLQAQADCRLLAERLEERFGDAARNAFHYIAVPRGGHIVLGMLAYALDLPSMRLEQSNSPDTPLVVVDDCAMSGARFRQVLARLPNRRIVFAALYAPPDLRAAIEEQEPRVEACISAYDLEDHAPRRQGEHYPAWREWQRSSRREGAYWYGQYPPIAFAWNEPDAGFWNAATGQREKAWNLVPPELCMKNRAPASLEAARIQVQRDGPGPMNPPGNVLFADVDDTILVADAVSGETYALRDVSADMWRALVGLGDLEPAAARLQTLYAVDEATLMDDLRTFTDELVAGGLLERLASS